MTRRNLAVLALYSLLTLVLTYPLPGRMNEALAGRSSDVCINPWADWWTKKALSEGLDFYHTDYMFYPQGASLVFHSFSHANTFISLLLTPLVGRLVAYNVTILLAYVLSGFSMYLLASHLTGCPPAAFVAGLVFTFHPYHIYESAHPVLVTTQWIPLFVLALTQILYDPDAGRIKQPLLAACWFLLTALSSWHLMMMLAGWTALYLLHSLFRERTNWAPGALRALLLLAIIAGLLMSPFLWPIIHEQLTEDTTYMAVDTQVGSGNDLLSFLIPNEGHPWLSSHFAGVYEKIGISSARPAYLGYVPLCLSIVGIVTARRKARPWAAVGIVAFVLSLGPQIVFGGTPLHTFRLPWAIPIINVLRHPFRLNVLIFFSLAVLAGFGSRWLYRQATTQNKTSAYLSLGLVGSLALFEYLVLPFPTIQPMPDSPFFSQLAQEEGDFAVVDFPMGRNWAKRYLFYQTIHGKKMVDGVVSRTPADVYGFVDANPLLGPLHAETAPDSDLDIEGQFAILADQGIRYIVIHQPLLKKSEELDDWRRWLAYFPPPFYKDNSIVVYATDLKVGRGFEPVYEPLYKLEAQSVTPVEITQGGSLFVDLHWESQRAPRRDVSNCLTLINTAGKTSQEVCGDPLDDWTMTEGFTSAMSIADHVFQVDPHLPGGEYVLATRLVEPETTQNVGEMVTLETITVAELPRVFDIPEPQHVVSAAFGRDLLLLGYDVTPDIETLHLTLHWQARRRMSQYYKFFAHLFTCDTSEVVAQADVVPRDWTYPTTWWEAGEVVSDVIPLSLTGVPPGTYRLAVGVYDPKTGARLPVTNAAGERLPDDQIMLPGEVTR